MEKIDRVSKSIDESRVKGNNPVKVRMSRAFAIALKSEAVPVMGQHFIDGRMTVYGVPIEIDDTIMRGFALEVHHE